MKKLIALLLALVMVVGLVACGAKEEAAAPAATEAAPAATEAAPAETEAAPVEEEGTKTIAGIAKGESHAVWQAVKAGAEQAGAEMGYTITFRGPASESAKDIPSQQEMVQTALSSNVDGIVLATIGTGYVDLLTQAYDKEIPVVQFDSGIWADDVAALDAAGKNPILAHVATSNTKAAAVAADHLFETIKADIAAAEGTYVVGVIQHDESQTGIDRATGFIDQFVALADADETTKGKYEIAKEVKPGDANNAYIEALDALYEKGAKAIFMCNEGVVKQVSDAIASAPGKYDAIMFSGFDAGTKQINWIKATEGPKLVGSVAQDSIMIGYNATMECIKAVEGGAAANVEIGGAWYDATNIDEQIAANLVYEG